MNLADVLEQCLQEIEAGATVEECLARYPEYAEELRPLLQTAVLLRQAPRATPAPAFRAATRERLRRLTPPVAPGASRDGRVHFPAPIHWWQRLGETLSRRRWAPALVGTLVAVLLLVVVGGSVVSAAGNSLPGQPLYRVKRATEHLALGLASSEARRVDLRLKFAARRLQEAAQASDYASSLIIEYVRDMRLVLVSLQYLHAQGEPMDELEALAESALAEHRRMIQGGRGEWSDALYRQALAALMDVQGWLTGQAPEATVVLGATPTATPIPPTWTPTALAPTSTLPASPTPLPLSPTPLVGLQGGTPTPTTKPSPLPTATVFPSPTPVPPTSTPVPPTPTARPAPPTPTPTSVPPTPTPVPPTPTPVPPTATPVPPTATYTPQPYPPATETPGAYPEATATVTPSLTPVPPTATPTTPPNAPPVITGLRCEPCQIEVGGRALLVAEVSDPDGDELSAHWEGFPDIGDFAPAGGPFRIYYVANFGMNPGDTATITILLTVRDNRGGSAEASVQIRVVSPGDAN